jgi:RNA polymerase subunit RPABC4/transcription elongation factor Spt4
MAAYQRAWRDKNPEKVRAGKERCREKNRVRRREWRKENRDKYLAQHRLDGRRRREKHGDRLRVEDVVRRYGITVEEHNRLMAESRGLCAICGQPETRTYRGRVKVLAVDHNHVTGKVRGLLCHNCNTMIAMSREQCGVLIRATEYLNSGGAAYAAEGW